MMTGRVNRNRQPRMRIRVRGPGQHTAAISVVVDSGYNGFLMLPRKTIAKLQLLCTGQGWATLADDSGSWFDMFRGDVEWDGIWRRVPIAACGSVPCIGMSLLNGFELQLRGRIGSQFTIEATD